MAVKKLIRNDPAINRKIDLVVSFIADEDEYTDMKFLDLPVGTIIKTPNGYSFAITFKDGKKYCKYINLEDESAEAPITEADEWRVRKDETVIYPHGYESPLWKVLNGEDVE